MPLVSTNVGEHVQMSLFVSSITTQKFYKQDSSSMTTPEIQKFIDERIHHAAEEEIATNTLEFFNINV